MNEAVRSPSSTPAKAAVDSVTVSVIQGALENIAIEMGYKLMRMSYSSIIRESEDFGAALIDTDNQQLAEAKQSTPLQSGPIPGYIRGLRRQLSERGEEIREGDVFMHNDAYAGASHGPDVAFVVPAFHDGVLAGFAVTTAHHLDIGALTPGSGGIVDAIDCYAEGLRFQAVKVYEEGKRNDQVWNMLASNIRLADLVLGDMEAQVAAARIGAARYLELLDRYGRGTVEAAAAAIYDTSERRLRAAIDALPDGTYSATTHIDGFLDDEDERRRDLPIKVTIHVRGDELTVDLTGTAPQVSDRPINMPLEGDGRLRGLAGDPFRPAGLGGPRRDSAEQRADTANQDCRARGHAGEPNIPGARHCPLLPGNRTLQCGRPGAGKGRAQTGVRRLRQRRRHGLHRPSG